MSWQGALPPRKPTLEAPIRVEVQLYSTDDLRRLYHKAEGGDDTWIRLRGGNIRRGDARAVILRRLWWERFAYVVLLGVTVIGAIAAVIAAIEGWPR